MRGRIIEKPHDFVICGSGGFGFLGRNVADGNEHGGVNSYGVVEQGSDDILEKGDSLWWEHGGGIRGFGVLDCSAIIGSLT